MSIIFMPLEDEGTTVWRPVEAADLGDGRFRVLGPVPDGETWKFAPGSIVRTRMRRYASGEKALEAFEISD